MRPLSRRSEDPFSRAGDRARAKAEALRLGAETAPAHPPAGLPVEEPPCRARSYRKRPLGAALAVVCAVAVLAGPAGADPPPSDPAAQAEQEKVDREQTHKRSEQVKAQIDVLQASDDQLNAELLKIDEQVKQQEARAGEANAGRDQARAEAADLARQVDEAQKQADEASRAAAERAIEAYMRPERETAAQMISAKDPQQLGEMHLLVSHVAEYDHSILVHRQTAQYLLTLRQNELAETQRKADDLARQANDDQQRAEDLKQQRVAVHDEMERRIGGLKGEAEALEQQEANLTALIMQHQSAAATTTTTPAPTTTTTAAPVTTAPPPGSPTTPKPPTTTAAPTTAPPTTAKPPPTGTKLSWPVSGPVTSGFGPRWGTFHKGIDIGVPEGTPIHAAADGTVFYSGVMDGYGNVILIDHGGGLVTLYAHQSQLIAGNGQHVSRGETIGLVGSTGNSTGPHLHFEVRVNGVAYDPLGYL